MKINRVAFKNFKSYVARTEFDFLANKHINILMGENGNGKTSFLEGISLAFFGCKMFNSTYITKDYTNFVCSRLSRTADNNKIELYIEYEDEGTIYNLSRIYKIASNETIAEDFTIFNGDVEVDTTNFLSKYDYSIMEQYFLNGETINDLIANNKIDKFIANFIDIAFSLNVFGQVAKDLEKIEKKELSSIKSANYKEVEKEVLLYENRLNSVEKNIAKNNENILIVQNNISDYNKKLQKQGININDKLGDLLERNEKQSEKSSVINKKLKEILLIDMQYMLQAKLLKNCLNYLKETRKERVSVVKSIYDALNNEKQVSLPNNFISLEIELIIASNVKFVDDNNLDKILRLVNDSVIVKKDISRLRNSIGKLNNGREYLDILNEYDRLQEELDNLKLKSNELNNKKNSIVDNLKAKQKEFDDYNNKHMKQKINDELLTNKDTLKTIVNKYVRIKTNEFNELVASKCLEILNQKFLRKKDLVDKISLTNGRLQLFKDGKNIAYNSFSAGEKQLLIVGLLFAVIDNAKLEIPLILDSFIGRLDLEHANNLMGYLKNNIYTQVIMLSTNSELKDKDIKLLGNSVGSIHNLCNDGYETTIKRRIYENKD
ncbi:MAG: hypothetical protein ACK5NF_07430 [Bacilli bacterium]